jgi:hypothetical protein
MSAISPTFFFRMGMKPHDKADAPVATQIETHEVVSTGQVSLALAPLDKIKKDSMKKVANTTGGSRYTER